MKTKNHLKRKCKIISKFHHFHRNGDIYEHFCEVHNLKWKAMCATHTHCVVRPDIRKKIWGKFNPFEDDMRTTKKTKKQRNKGFPYRKSSGRDKSREGALKSKFEGKGGDR